MDRTSSLRAIAAVLWCLAVAAFYYAYNADYYWYKIVVFGRFFFPASG
jgi:hypothetical protein